MDNKKDYLVEKLGKPKRLFLLGLILSLPFFFLVWMSYRDWGFVGTLDDAIGTGFYKIRAPWLSIFFIAITRMGDVWFVALFTTVILLIAIVYLKNVKIGVWYVLTVAIGAGVINQLFKFIFQRPRPSVYEHLVIQGGYSFPSGHAMGSVITYGALLFIIIRSSQSWKVPFISALIIIPMILLIGLSRIYVGVHYASDILGGFSMGLAFLSVSLGIYSLFLTEKEIKEGKQV